MRDVALTRDEVVGLMAGLLTSEAAPTNTTRLPDWLFALSDDSDDLMLDSSRPWRIGQKRLMLQAYNPADTCASQMNNEEG